jgi:excisionase family DNA binding protein
VSDAGRHSLFNEAALRELIGEIVAEKLAAVRPQFMSVADAAKMAAVSSDFIREQIATGKLGRYRAGREWRVKQSELEALLATSAAAPLADEAVTTPAKDPTEAAVLRFMQRDRG